ncbi:hypothetical protein CTRC69_04345 [Chlamydia trachomatis RC-F/69]|nr:hypothetical protein CTL2C_72 [Chlamydia trachomatis L2c]AGJ64277.1 hypothetical protein CTLINITIAL_00980 [Chlamydia trachomatis L2/434/Bu(i)]AGJ65217.1 hypothetical protein CTLFINAL_00980 [Chlamydia trachomatis L2/434/Bu(f)]AGR94265.1 hypothetical protein CTRC69_04345 [Chlamydia trachomatis RC-F/69]AGR95191.1 hypothetical protein CTRC46_04330 [Chlamydia trachomatis RC-L2(s)/46]AGR97070.1 hypothetical protein CTRC943_04315 [Chlamydia trachomatis RC-J/943]AGR97990.1 hypothetical protein CTR
MIVMQMDQKNSLRPISAQILFPSEKKRKILSSPQLID